MFDLERIEREEPGLEDRHPLWKHFNTWCLKEFGIGGKEVPKTYFAAYLEGTRGITSLEDSPRLFLLATARQAAEGYWIQEPDSMRDLDKPPPEYIRVPFEVLRPVGAGRYLAILPEYRGDFSLTEPVPSLPNEVPSLG